MSRSWNHVIRAFSPVELASRRTRSARLAEMFPDHRNYEAKCSVGRCEHLAVYLAGFNYVTGQKGRVSQQCRQLCEEHGQGFAKKYNVEIQREAAS